MNIAIIPARGGSQRIPRKNLRHFCGRPIIAYSIEAALASNCFDEVMVSTDDDEIAEIATMFGAKVPFRRSIQNSSHTATTADALLEVLTTYGGLGRNWEYLCCLYPTAPFITPELLKVSFQMLTSKAGSAKTVFPIVKYSHPIQRALSLHNGCVSMNHPENRDIRTQELEPRYHDAGQFYWLETKKFLEKKIIIESDAIGIPIHESKIHDIDSEIDWLIAEMKFRALHKKS